MKFRSEQVKESLALFQNSQGVEIRATLLRVNFFSAVIEFYYPFVVLRVSEVLGDFRILFQEETLYAGRAVVRSLVNAGPTVVCEITLDETAWGDMALAGAAHNGSSGRNLAEFLEEWQKLYRIEQEYKLVVADMHSFFTDLRVWLDKVELGVRSAPEGNRLELEQTVAGEVCEPVLPMVNALFERFEAIATRIDLEKLPAHRGYMRRQMHPLLLAAPFPARAFYKPLGYAGDYELVNMMARNAHEGASLYAKVVNTWFVRQAPAQAHRNRLKYLKEVLVAETGRARYAGRLARIFNVACGPAQELQQFLLDEELSGRADLHLLDFNEETLLHARRMLEEARAQAGRPTGLHYIKKSIHTVLKESARSVARPQQDLYDLVYCAGLFDYLSDPICQRLMDVMYEWLIPGGLLVVTNVEPRNPMRQGMEHLLDWHLVYRDASGMRTLRPRQASEDLTRVICDDTGVNLFLEVRKPANG